MESHAEMLPIPLIITVCFFIELFGCIFYTIFLVFLATNKQTSIKNPFFKFFIATGVAGILVVSTFWLPNIARYLPARNDNPAHVAFVYIGQICVGSSLFWYTIGKFITMIHRFHVLANPGKSSSEWSSRTTTIMIVCQFVLPTIPNLHYVIFPPINWTNGAFDGLDNTTGSIVRITAGIFYALFALVSVPMNVFVYLRLRKLSSVAFYKEQRSLVIYTIASTSTHLMIAFHQFIWAYVFFVGARGALVIMRDSKLIVCDLATFIDPFILLILSKQVRRAIYQRFFGTHVTVRGTTTGHSTLALDRMYRP